MQFDPMPDEAREVLRRAVGDPKGAKLEGRAQKKAAREVVRRGLGSMNKSATRLRAHPAGKFVVSQESR